MKKPPPPYYAGWHIDAIPIARAFERLYYSSTLHLLILYSLKVCLGRSFLFILPLRWGKERSIEPSLYEGIEDHKFDKAIYNSGLTFLRQRRSVPEPDGKG